MDSSVVLAPTLFEKQQAGEVERVMSSERLRGEKHGVLCNGDVFVPPAFMRYMQTVVGGGDARELEKLLASLRLVVLD